MSTDPFRGTRALVTGASSGLGEEFARQLARHGCDLVLTARSREPLEELAEVLRRKHEGLDVRVVTADLGVPGGAAELCAAVDALGVDIDHLVSNAGYGRLQRFVEGDLDDQAAMVRLNCEVPVHLARHFLPGMVERGRGGVVNVASTAAFQPAPYYTVYAATKSFVLSFSSALTEELRGTGVRVTVVCPGPVLTGFQEAANQPAPAATQPSVLSAPETVRLGLDAYSAGRRVCITGTVNRLQALAAKLAPREFIVRAAGKQLAAMQARGYRGSRRS